jgi:RNA polymerase sigma-70 factor (ECF subfamily)
LLHAVDLVQETLLRALSNIHSFQRGKMLRAWLFTIMRNSVYTNVKKRAGNLARKTAFQGS